MGSRYWNTVRVQWIYCKARPVKIRRGPEQRKPSDCRCGTCERKEGRNRTGHTDDSADLTKAFQSNSELLRRSWLLAGSHVGQKKPSPRTSAVFSHCKRLPRKRMHLSQKWQVILKALRKLSGNRSVQLESSVLNTDLSSAFSSLPLVLWILRFLLVSLSQLSFFLDKWHCWRANNAMPKECVTSS